MNNLALSQNQYQALLSDLREIISRGIKNTQEYSRFQLVLTYWEVGKKISSMALTTNADYSSFVLNDLTKDLNLERTILVRSVQFFNLYPNKPKSNGLSWSHYKNLLAIKNDDLRLELENKARQENWKITKLISTINSLKGQETTLGNVVGSENNQKSTLIRPTSPNYLYKATIENVIDGDTLLLNIDLGFEVFKKQRVRLAKIDAKEMDEEKGQEAFRYLQNLVASLEVVAIKTNKIDIYGRYLADIFYLNKAVNNQTTQIDIFNDGVYLNQELVEKGLASIF